MGWFIAKRIKRYWPIKHGLKYGHVFSMNHIAEVENFPLISNENK